MAQLIFHNFIRVSHQIRCSMSHGALEFALKTVVTWPRLEIPTKNEKK